MTDVVDGPAGPAARSAGVRRLDHVAVAVLDARKAMELYVGQLGASFVLGGDNEETGNRIIHLALGGFKIELMQPLARESQLARTIDKRGEGVHHVTFVVDDLAATIQTFDAANFELVGTDLSNPVWRETFIRPRDASGALVQLVTTTEEWGVPVDGITADDVIKGRAVFRHARPCWRDAATVPITREVSQ